MKSTAFLLLLPSAFNGVALAALNADALTRQYFQNDAAWFRDRIPLFEINIPAIQDVYYYRWNIFRTHQRDLGPKGYISTEFLDNVGWQTQPWASLNDATGFHIREGRWCRDQRFARDYAAHILSTDSNNHQFSEVMGDSVWQTYLVNTDSQTAINRLNDMQRVYNEWQTRKFDFGGLDESKGLYWIQPLTDATEYTISSIDASGGQDGFFGGHAFRPTISSYQYANALAIANILRLRGDTAGESTWRQKAATIKTNTQNALWNDTLGHFIDRYYVDNQFVKYWTPIRGRELAGYVPWYHELPDDNPKYRTSWSHLTDTAKFLAQRGLRTNEPSYQYYMRQYRYEGSRPECQWNGPIWPYQVTQVLGALSNLITRYPNSNSAVNGGTYINLLSQYARLHTNPSRGNTLNLEENYYPDSGAPIVGLARSPHYFHSGYIDLILTGLAGLRPRADNTIEVFPTIDSSVSYFRIDRIIYHNRDIAIQWDATGARYGAKGLRVEVDGRVVASSDTIRRLTADMGSTSTPTRPVANSAVALSVQLQPDIQFPRGSVSVANQDAYRVHGAIDGRIWFYPELANGWDTPVGDGSEVWYQIDFGRTVRAGRAEVAFFVNQGFDVPERYRVQTQVNGNWVDVSNGQYSAPVANGVTGATWTAASTNLVRLVFTPKRGVRVRLAEFKVYES